MKTAEKIKGAYGLVIAIPRKLIGGRDPRLSLIHIWTSPFSIQSNGKRRIPLERGMRLA